MVGLENEAPVSTMTVAGATAEHVSMNSLWSGLHCIYDQEIGYHAACNEQKEK